MNPSAEDQSGSRRSRQRRILLQWLAIVVGSSVVAATITLSLVGAIFFGRFQRMQAPECLRPCTQIAWLYSYPSGGDLSWVKRGRYRSISLLFENCSGFDVLSPEFHRWAEEREGVYLSLEDCQISDHVLQSWLLEGPATRMSIYDRYASEASAQSMLKQLQAMQRNGSRNDALRPLKVNYGSGSVRGEFVLD